MPFIDDDKLAALYKEVDKEKKASLFFQKHYFDNKPKLVQLNRYKYGFFSSALIFFGFICYSLFFSDSAFIEQPTSREQQLINKINLLENGSTSNVQTALANQTVYSVQFIASERDDILMFSKNFVNFRAHNLDDLNAYSLGNFAHKQEAEAFKEELIKLGLNDLWITSFKQGERILFNDE